MFLHGGVVIVQVFPHTFVHKAYSAPDAVLVANVARDLVKKKENLPSPECHGEA